MSSPGRRPDRPGTGHRPQRAVDVTRDPHATGTATPSTSFRRLNGWVGYAEEPRDRARLRRPPLPVRPLRPARPRALAGWVEYPYSQTNYAASTAGCRLSTPPSVERLQNSDGSWKVIEPHAGYPAGLPRITTLDLTGKLNGPRCVLRLRTNMECYWDQASLILRDPTADRPRRRVRTTQAPSRGPRTSWVAAAILREGSPDGKRAPPLSVRPRRPRTSSRFMAGQAHPAMVTSDRSLLRTTDDRLCLVGPGDEVRLEFEAKGLPSPSRSGWVPELTCLKAVRLLQGRRPVHCTRATGSNRSPGEGCPRSRSWAKSIDRPTRRIRTTSRRSRRDRPGRADAAQHHPAQHWFKLREGSLFSCAHGGSGGQSKRGGDAGHVVDGVTALCVRRVRGCVLAGMALLAVSDGPGPASADGYRAHQLPGPSSGPTVAGAPSWHNPPEDQADVPRDRARMASTAKGADDPVVLSIRGLPTPPLSLDARQTLAEIEKPLPPPPAPGRNQAHTIPEPPSILLLLAGLSIFGVAARRRLLRTWGS